MGQSWSLCFASMSLLPFRVNLDDAGLSVIFLVLRGFVQGVTSSPFPLLWLPHWLPESEVSEVLAIAEAGCRGQSAALCQRYLRFDTTAVDDEC